VVTVVGVAYRGQIPLENIRPDFQIEPVTDAELHGFGVNKTVTLHGTLSDTERRRLHRAAEYCPVGQLFTKGALVIDDQVECRAADAAEAGSRVLQPGLSAAAVCTSGTVQGRYLVETKEYDNGGVMLHEGEVKLYLACANHTRPGRWTLIAGHSGEGWMPPPVPLTYAGLAASTVTTLRQRIPAEAWPAAGFHVEIAPHGGGNRDQAQTSAAEGLLNTRRISRKVVLHGAADTALLQAIEAALPHDPLTASFRDGGVLLGEQVVLA
jgi:uncharacterized OsmC-like protein